MPGLLKRHSTPDFKQSFTELETFHLIPESHGLVTSYPPPVTSSLFTSSLRSRTGAPEADMSRRSRAARRRIVLGMKVAAHKVTLQST
jgi:hypothetical protein